MSRSRLHPPDTFAALPRVDGALEGVVGAIEIAEPADATVSATASVHVASGAAAVIAELGWRPSETPRGRFRARRRR